MEVKTLKIDSDLHEKLKSVADDKNTSMQKLIESKLGELVEREDDILFSINEINFDKKCDSYNININKQSFKKLITFFEIFLTNRNLKNVNEIENLLKVISYLKSNINDSKIKESKNDDDDLITNLNKFNEYCLNEMKNEQSLETKNELSKIINNIASFKDNYAFINTTQEDNEEEITDDINEDTDSSVDMFKNAYNDFKLKIEEMQSFIKNDVSSSISIMGTMTKLENLKEQFLQVEKTLNNTTDYIKDKKEIEDKEKKEKEDFIPVDIKELEEKYKYSILNEIKKFDIEDFKNKENEKKLEIEKALKIEEEAKLVNDYPMADFFELKIGDIIRDNLKELEYEIIKICNMDNMNSITILTGDEDYEFCLKCITPILKDAEININLKSLIDLYHLNLRRYTIDDNCLLTLILSKETKYKIYLDNIRNVKSLIKETIEEYNEFSKIYALSPLELLDNMNNLNNAYENNLTYDEMKNILKEAKLWKAQTETELNLSEYWMKIK